MLNGVRAQRALEKRLSDIEMLARMAHTNVLRDQEAWLVVFEESRVYLGQASGDVEAYLDEANSGVTAVKEVELDGDEDVFLKRTGWEEWLRVELPELWRFEPRAMLEPVEIRIQSKHGWIQGRFDPLTARVDDVLMEAGSGF